MTLQEFRRNEELRKVLGIDVPLPVRLYEIDRQIHQCETYFHHKFKPDGQIEADPTCNDLIAAIRSRNKNDRSEFGALTQDMQDVEVHESETVASFLTLIDLYVVRGRLRRELVRQTETSAAQVESWRDSDHSMVYDLECEHDRTLARLLARHGNDNPEVKTGQEAQDTKAQPKAEDDEDKEMENH